MKAPNKLQIVAAILFGVTILSLVVKLVPISKNLDDFYAEEMYNVTFKFFLKTDEEKTKVKTYLPKNNDHQRITDQNQEVASHWAFSQEAKENNIQGIWQTNRPSSYETIDYSFVFEGKVKSYRLPPKFEINSDKYPQYLEASEHIQVHDDKISFLADELTSNAKTHLQSVRNIYTYVHEIPNAPLTALTDAVTALEQYRASCNGKSRLLVALARNIGFPSRIKGGLVLEKGSKRTSHSWVEININDQWIPFDPTNGHFAHLPANYMELYEGDEFLITHVAALNFDYIYDIEKQSKVPFLKMNASDFSEISPISLWSLIENKVLSMEALVLLLMLPLGGLLVAFLRNVVGLRTFGVFLPVLIAFSLLETGFATGISLFLFLILFVGLVSRPFNNMGLLHTPKLVISLTLMVLVMVIGSYIGVITGIGWLSALTFFPTIILTVSAEKFSTLIVEDGFQKASGTLLQTLLAVSFCYFMLSSQWLASVLILFPEILLLIVMAAMGLGRYIGLRWTELIRFKPLLKFKTA